MTGGFHLLLLPVICATTPHGNIDKPFDLCSLAQGAGATYVARGTAYHAVLMQKLIENGIQNKRIFVL